MKVKKGLAILLSSVMVLQMSTMAFAAELDDPEEFLVEIGDDGVNEYVTEFNTDFTGGEASVEPGSFTPEGLDEITTFTYTATPDANNKFYKWAIYDNHQLNVASITKDIVYDGSVQNDVNVTRMQEFTTTNQIFNLVALFLHISSPTSKPVEESHNDSPAPVQDSEPQVPEEPDSTGQITIVDTSKGNALPTTELGDAIASTRTLSINICNISPRQYSQAVQETVAKTPEGGNIVIETNQVACFDKNMMQAFAKKSTVNIFVVFKNKAGKKVLVTIPAGYDVMSLLDENGYCGFLHLADVFGSKEL